MAVLEIKTVTITEKGQIAIPKGIRKKEGFKVGTKIALIAFEDHVEIRSLSSFNEKMFPALATEKVLARDWNSPEEDTAWRNL